MENIESFLHQQIYSTLFSVTNKLQITGDKHLEGLTSRQLVAMISIVHLPEGEATLSAIAKNTGTTKQNISQIINIMERKGYVVIMKSSTDKRAYNIQITESGKEVTMNSYIGVNEFYEELFKDFTMEEMKIFLGYLKKLYRFDGDNLNESGEDAVF